MIDMVGIGPFITIPYILATMGGARCMAAWLLAGVLAICDGIVTAELAAEMPHAGGSYIFLRESFGRAGRLISFLFLFQILVSAPLSMASGCIGFAQYLEPIWPVAGRSIPITATIVCVLIVILLLRRIDVIGRLSVVLWIGVLATLAVVIAVGLPHLKLDAFAFWRAPRHDNLTGFAGLGAAMIFAVYDYLGYYNIAYLGDEVKDPEKTITRVIVISILAIAVIYTVMQACIISVLPYETATKSHFVVADYIKTLAGSTAARWVSGLILWTAFASIFSVMLGYSRILFAAARDNNFFSIRAIIPFAMQVAGSIVLRERQPDRPRPFRMWLYPLPAIVALGLWLYVAFSPEKHQRIGALYVIAAGALFYFVREALIRRRAA